MGSIRFAGPLAIFLVSIAGAYGQELGTKKAFGENGRLFSSGSSDYYVLSMQSYATEDSAGYQGSIRIVKKYRGGGYEIIFRDYVARCSAPFDHMVQIMWSEAGKEDYSDTVPIKTPDKRPAPEARESYNLYWAACRGVYKKFN